MHTPSLPILQAILDPPPSPHIISGFEGGEAAFQATLDLAQTLKRNPSVFFDNAPLRGKILTALFLNPSLRTRTSFEAAMVRLGGHMTSLTPGSSSWTMEFEDDVVMNQGAAEHIREAAPVLSSYSDALGLRSFASMQDFTRDMADTPIYSFAHHANTPVISFESARFHPCQALADALTLREHLPTTQGKRFTLAWATHPKMCGVAVPHSTLLTAARLGMHVTLAHPQGYDLHPEVIHAAHTLAGQRGGSLEITHDLREACTDTHVIYAKAWGSPLDYGNPTQGSARNAQHASWTLQQDHLTSAHDDALFMHCLPVRRNVVATSQVLDGPHSIILPQAENRMWAQMALLLRVLDADLSPFIHSIQ